MNPNTIENIQAELAGEIALRQDAINALSRLNSEPPRPKLLEPILAVPRGRASPEAARTARRGKAVRTAPAASHRGRVSVFPFEARVAKLAQPFDTGTLARTAGANWKTASSFIQRALKAGRLVRSGRGQFSRSATFDVTQHGQKLLAEIHREIETEKPE